ncbi:MAG: YceI family protein [Thermoleophilia bacterium]
MTATANGTATVPDLTGSAWSVDPARSRVEFRVRHFWGLMTVTGHFTRFDGGLDMNSMPAIGLDIEAASVDTGNAKRDKHLRSADFFDAEAHPRITFASEEVTVRGGRLAVTGAPRRRSPGRRADELRRGPARRRRRPGRGRHHGGRPAGAWDDLAPWGS